MSASAVVPINLSELGRLIQAVEPGAILVPERLLRRAIKFDRKLTMIGLRVPHRTNFVIGRETLLGLAAAVSRARTPGHCRADCGTPAHARAGAGAHPGDRPARV